MKKYLPFIIPEICGYGHLSILLGILGDSPSTSVLEWFAQSYVQLMSLPYKKTILFDTEFGDNQFMHSPFLDKYIIPFSFFKQCKVDIIDFSREALSKNSYVGFVCDRFYFPFLPDIYGKEHYTHFSLLSGFDDDTQTVRITDYFNSKFSSYDCPFDFLRRAGMSEYCHSDQPFEDSIICIKKREATAYPYTFNMDRLIFLIHEYLKGYESDQIIKGISIYKALAKYTKESCLKYNTIQTLYDHKLAMCYRLKILQVLGYIDLTEDDRKFFHEVLNQAMILRNALVRQTMLDKTRAESALPKMLDSISRFEELDYKTMTRLLDILVSNSSFRVISPFDNLC